MVSMILLNLPNQTASLPFNKYKIIQLDDRRKSVNNLPIHWVKQYDQDHTSDLLIACHSI